MLSQSFLKSYFPTSKGDEWFRSSRSTSAVKMQGLTRQNTIQTWLCWAHSVSGAEWRAQLWAGPGLVQEGDPRPSPAGVCGCLRGAQDELLVSEE